MGRNPQEWAEQASETRFFPINLTLQSSGKANPSKYTHTQKTKK